MSSGTDGLEGGVQRLDALRRMGPESRPSDGKIPSNNERHAQQRAADVARQRAAVEGANHPEVRRMPGGYPGSESVPKK